MTESDFYLTLTSDNCDTYYPSNTISRFTTYLPRNVVFHGDWRIGLSEIQFPNSFNHVNADEAVIMFIENAQANPSTPVQCMIPHGVYPDIDSLIRCINRNSLLSKHFQLTFDKMTNFIMIKRTCKSDQCIKHTHKLVISEKLSNILGFDFVWTGVEFSNLSFKVGKYPASLERGLPDRLYIYSDMCSSHIVGSQRTPLLRIVPFNSTNCVYGSNFSMTFTPYYFPLLHNSFQSIEIDIRDKYMNSVPFKYGPVNVTLHFKRVE